MRTRRYLQIFIISFTVAVLTSPDATGSNPQQHPQKLEVFNGSGSGEYRDGENVNLIATVKEGYEFVRWYAVAGNGTLKNEEKEEATYVMGDDPAEVVAVFAKVSSWFPPGEEEGDEKVGLLLTKPQEGAPMRLEQKIKVRIDRGKNPKPKLKEIWDKLRLQLEWKDTSLAQYYALEKGGDAMESGSRDGIPKDKFEEKGEAYEGSIWYEGGLDSDEMAARDGPPEVKTVVKLVIGDTLGKISAEGKLAALYLVVDANRGGDVAVGSSEDKTTQKNPYAFWVNNDFDRDDEDKPSGSLDWKDGTIQCIRDLEDFARLKVSVKGQRKAILDGKLKLGLEWKDATGSPAVQIYPHIEKEGGEEYLKDVGAAQKQLSSGGSAIKAKGGAMTIEKGQAKIFLKLPESDASRDFKKDGMLHLLFEACGEGKGRLSVVIFDEKEKKLGEGVGVWLDLKDVKKMYVSSEGNAFDKAPPDEALQTVVFVHGWNMSPEGSRNYAETMFKRLWHRGFKGRFAYFRWNTDWLSTTDVITTLTTLYFANYNNSEYRAWTQGAPALKSFVSSLPHAKNIVAHSMGNIVASEAMRLGMRVNNYALLQPAVPAACYDERPDIQRTQTATHTVQLGLWDITQIPVATVTVWDKETPDNDLDVATRNMAYRGVLKNISQNGNLILFFQPNDEATSYAWEVNNAVTKPPGGMSGDYYYKRNNPSGEKLFKLISTAQRDVYTYLTNRHTAMAYACKTWGKAAGAEPQTGGAIGAANRVNLNASTYHLPGVDGGFGRNHSGQFNANIQSLKPFYDELLDKLGIESNP